ncbi:protein kinase domain-containing protein [Streptomyces sp. CA-288835]|uniref:serine/threonine-protein kinase n=1 Tax=Streptomyces sp. CA-288835 TaxID=3240069 RepID=UPI003D8B83CD
MKSLQPSDPSSIGGYPLLGRLGAGGMGQVFMSRTTSGRLLALKTVRDDLSSDPAFEKRFTREIRNSDRVRSPWTVTVVDYSAAGQRPQWLATEYVPAPPLHEWVDHRGPLPEAALLSLAAELCGALQAVHEAGLSHRDLKPGNVLLGRDRPLLIDFGLARATDDTRHTSLDGVIGSPGFLSPDQATGGAGGAPADLFSLAAVLVYAARGHGPFSQPDEDVPAATLMYRVVHEEPDIEGVPAALAPLLASCLAKDPDERPTAAELRKQLDEIGARTGDWPDVCPRTLGTELAARERPVQTLIDLDPEDPHSRTVLYTALLADPADPADPANPTAPVRRRRPVWLIAAAAAVAAVAVAGTALLAVYANSPGSTDDSTDSSASVRASATDVAATAERSPSGNAKAPGGADVPAGMKRSSSPSAGDSAAVDSEESRKPSRPAGADASAADDGASTEPSPSVDARDEAPNEVVVQAPYSMMSGHVLENADGRTRMVMQKDGNLLITDADRKPLWDANVYGEGNYARFQTDGNLVVRNKDGEALWGAGTSRKAGATLVLQEDGNVVIKLGSNVLWEANTAH